MFEEDDGPQRPLPGLLKDLGSDDEMVRGRAVYSIRTCPPEGHLEGLLELLDSENPNQVYEAAGLLGEAKEMRAVEKLSTHLSSEWNDIRRSAAWALGEIGAQAAVKPLAERLGDMGKDGSDGLIFLSHEKVPVNRFVASALAKLGAPAVKPAVWVLGSGDVPAREAAAWVLGEVGLKDALLPLEDALSDDARGVRSNAVEALGKLGLQEAVRPVSRMLKDPEKHVRRIAAQVLGELGFHDAVPALRDALNDEILMVRERAERSLKMLGDDPSEGEDLQLE